MIESCDVSIGHDRLDTSLRTRPKKGSKRTNQRRPAPDQCSVNLLTRLLHRAGLLYRLYPSVSFLVWPEQSEVTHTSNSKK